MTRQDAFAVIAAALTDQARNGEQATAEQVEAFAAATAEHFAVARLILLERGRSPEYVAESLAVASRLLDTLRAWGLRDAPNPLPRPPQEVVTPPEVQAVSIGVLGLV